MKKILDGDWNLRLVRSRPPEPELPDGISDAPFCVPGDVHSALLQSGQIETPYFRDNELAVDWVNRCEWIIEREFEIDQSWLCLLYTSPSPRDLSTSRMPSSA